MAGRREERVAIFACLVRTGSSCFRSFVYALAVAALAVLVTHLPALGEDTPPGSDCAARPETGIWVVQKPQPKKFSRLEIQVDCSNGYYLARGFVRCGRTDCSWGYTRAFPEGDHVEIVFETFSAVHYVTTRYAGAAGLNVRIFSDYRAPNRPSAERHYVLTRER